MQVLPSTPQMPLSSLGLATCLVDSPERPIDSAVILHFREAPRLEALKLGALSARRCHPTTGCRILGRHWVGGDGTWDWIDVREAHSPSGMRRAIGQFLDMPFDPRMRLPVQQLLVRSLSEGRQLLVTRFHHSVGDGTSALIWLRHQLAVANGQLEPLQHTAPFEPLEVRAGSMPSVEPPAFLRPTERLWSQRYSPSGRRRWLTIRIQARALRARVRSLGCVDSEGLMLASAFAAFDRWNRSHSGRSDRRQCIWLPIDVRKVPGKGFGNGMSRIRVHEPPPDASLAEKCRDIGRQVVRSRRHQTWPDPGRWLSMRLPLFLMAPLVSTYLDRPWVDMGTALVSHHDLGAGGACDPFSEVRRVEFVGPVLPSHPMALHGASLGEVTWLTLVYDPALLTSADAHRLAAMYEEQVELGRQTAVHSSSWTREVKPCPARPPVEGVGRCRGPES